MDDGASYLNFLKTSSDKQSEIDLLIDLVSTHETSFFRHPNQITIFEKIIDERRMAGNKRINIWSAACSTGEEPYT
jgi:chemotaxis protein methyltransferase CheR